MQRLCAQRTLKRAIVLSECNDPNLQERPADDDKVGHDEEAVAREGGAGLVGGGDVLCPGFARRDAKHGDEGAVEDGEVLGVDIAVEGHPHDGICAANAPALEM